jgi:hypothetical protein
VEGFVKNRVYAVKGIFEILVFIAILRGIDAANKRVGHFLAIKLYLKFKSIPLQKFQTKKLM